MASSTIQYLRKSVRPNANILVQYCRTDTTREWLDTTRTTRTIRTGRETMVYESYRSWNNGDLHIISKTAFQAPPYNSYGPYGSCRSWNNGLRIVQLVNPIDIYILMIKACFHMIADDRGSRIADVLRSSAIIWKHTSAIVCDPAIVIADDRKRSQKIEPCSIFCDRLRSSAIVCDPVRSCDHIENKVLRSAIETDPIIFWIPTHHSMPLRNKATAYC